MYMCVCLSHVLCTGIVQYMFMCVCFSHVLCTGIVQYMFMCVCFSHVLCTGIVQYMREQLKPATVELKTASEVQRFISSDFGSVVAFFLDEEDSPLFSAYTEAANLARVGPVKFGYTRSSEAARAFAMKSNKIVAVIAPRSAC